MQPVRIDAVGHFPFMAASGRDHSPKVAFDETGSKMCLYSSTRLECYHQSSGWLKLFSWSAADIDLCSAESQLNWVIDNADFIENISGAEPSLYVILINKPLDFSLVCYFPCVSDGCCSKTILVRGLISSCEFVTSTGNITPHTHHSPDSDREGATFADTMNISESEPVRFPAAQPVTDIFSGCFALGFEQGYSGLLDLCLDSPSDSRDVTKPSSAVAMEKSEFLSGLKSHSRDFLSGAPEEHTFVHLDASVVRWADFHYKSVNGKLLNSFTAAQVYVSALRHIPNSQTLVVGFSFGGWQLWSLYTLEMIYALRHLSLHSPVTCVTFQEPSDDPRYCCYLWIGWQSRRGSDQQSVLGDAVLEKSCTNDAEAKLYQLSYLRRFDEPNSAPGDPTYRYQELIGLSERLSTTLCTVRPSGHSFPSDNHLVNIRSVRPSHSHPTRRVCAAHLVSLMWKVTPHVIRIGLFDLDCWYHAQMPTRICTDNSFFSVFDATVPQANGLAVNGHLVSSTLIPFLNQITTRDRQVTALCEPIRSTNSTATHGSPSVTTYAIPEVCLRPSALSFTFLLSWTTDKMRTGHDNEGAHRVTVSSLGFASRQEACLLSLSSFLSKPSAPESSTAPKRFEITDWVSEAWVTGLLESPSLDLLFEEELGRLLQLSLQLDGHPSKRCFTDTEFEQAGLRLVYGDDLDDSIVRELHELMPPPPGGISDQQQGCPKPSKKLKVAPAQSDRTLCESSRLILNPSWVLLANCLLEHGDLSMLRRLDQLASGCGPHSPASIRFRCCWLWLRFRRLKSRFDRLTCPLFDAPVDVLNNSMTWSPYELGCMVHQLQLLGQLSHFWFDSNESQRHADWIPFWTAVHTYAAYARLVALFCRMGLLPQKDDPVTGDPEVFPGAECLEDSTVTKNTLLCSYNPNVFEHVIWQLRSRNGSSVLTDDLPLSRALLKACLEESNHRTVWMEQEQPQQTDEETSSTRVYCPRRLQSLCSLWQLPSTKQLIRARFGLLGFLLCDATAVVTVVQRSSQATEANPQPNTPVIALKLCRRVMMLFAKEFPAVRPLLSTIFILWMLERGFFKETLDSRVRSFVLDSCAGPDRPQLTNLFPKQTELLTEYLHSCGQFDLVHQLTGLGRSRAVRSTPPKPCLVREDLRATGAPFLALSRIRRCLNKLRVLETHDQTGANLTPQWEDAGRAALIQLAEACRHCGRLGDLVNLGLTPSEAKALFEHYKTSGQYVVLFHCLLARKQYQAALSVSDEYHRTQATRPVSELLASVQKSSNKPSALTTPIELDMLSKLLSESLPAHYEDFAIDSARSVDPLLASFLADSVLHAPVQQAPFTGIAYRRGSALQCPLTTAKTNHSMAGLTRKRAYGELVEDGGDLVRASPKTPDMCRFKSVDGLLETAKKGSSEFWETFHVLEDIRMSCNLSRQYSRPSSFALDSRQSFASFNDSRKDIRNPIKCNDRLFSLIYTPPPKRIQRSHLDLFTTPTVDTCSARSSAIVNPHTPISILKSPAPTYTVTARPTDQQPPYSPHPNTTGSVLNVTLDDDTEVTLNLCTVRPSSTTLSATPILSRPARTSTTITTTSTFVFSAPRAVSVSAVKASQPTSARVSPIKSDSHLSVPSVETPKLDATFSTEQIAVQPSQPSHSKSTGSPDKCDMELTCPWSETPTADRQRTVSDSTSIQSLHKPSTLIPPWRLLTKPRSQSESAHPTKPSESSNPGTTTVLNESMDIDDSLSIASSTDDASSYTSDTPRRSARRTRPPKRYDPSKF